MDALVQTGQTKSRTEVSLSAKSLSTRIGEQVLILLQIEADPVAAKNLQKEVISIVEQSLVDTTGDTALRLDSTLKELNGLLKGLIMTKAIVDMHSVVAIVDTNGLLHVSHAGRAEAYVVRHGTASQITEYTKGKATPAFVHIASGQLEEGDTVVISSQRLLRAVTPAQLAQLSASQEDCLKNLVSALESENEESSLALIHVDHVDAAESAAGAVAATSTLRQTHGRAAASIVENALSSLKEVSGNIVDSISKGDGSIKERMLAATKGTRGKNSHLLLLAAALAVFLIVWAGVNLSSYSKKSQTKAEGQKILAQIDDQLQTAENRRLTGDTAAAAAMLERAEEQARQLMNSESGLFRADALDRLDDINLKREKISNIVRFTNPKPMASLADSKSTIQAVGFVGLTEEQFIVYDKQDLYRVIDNKIEEPQRLSDEELILDATDFPRYDTQVYLTTSNGIVETISGKAVSMKTEDPSGWITGKDMEAYLRYVYILSPENNQIYKYERKSNRYSAPAEYNVNADLSKALDFAIDGNIYVIKEGGEVTKLLRGEVQPFTIRQAPEGVLKDAVKVFKVFDGKLYFLDPTGSRVIIVTDGGESGESTYLKQYVFDGEQMGTLQDLYVDPDESFLYVMDEKRIYKIDLGRQNQ